MWTSTDIFTRAKRHYFVEQKDISPTTITVVIITTTVNFRPIVV